MAINTSKNGRATYNNKEGISDQDLEMYQRARARAPLGEDRVNNPMSEMGLPKGTIESADYTIPSMDQAAAEEAPFPGSAIPPALEQGRAAAEEAPFPGSTIPPALEPAAEQGQAEATTPTTTAEDTVGENRLADDAQQASNLGYDPSTREGAPFADAARSSFDAQGGVDRVGRPTTPDELADSVKDDRERDKKAAGIFGMNWRDQRELQDATYGKVTTDDTFAIKEASLHMAQQLAKTTITETTARGPVTSNAFEKIKDSYGVTPTQLENTLAVAASLVLPIISGATSLGDQKAQVEAIDMLNSLVGGDFSLGSRDEMGESRIDKSLTFRMLGAAAHKLLTRANNMVDEAGMPIDQSTLQKGSMNLDGLGTALGNSFLHNSGILTSKGVGADEQILISPLWGHKFYMATKGLQQQFSEAMLSKSTTAPVSDIGRSRTAQRNITAHKDRPDVEDLTEVERILGSTPLLPDLRRSWLAAAMFKMGIDYHNKKEGAVNTTKHAMIGLPSLPANANEEQVAAQNKILKTKASIVTKLLKGWAEGVARGVPRFVEHWSDKTVRRMYNKVNDYNMQRHTLARAVISAPEVVRQWRSNTHNTGVDRATAGKWWDDVGAFLRQERSDYHFKSAHMDEMAFLFSAAHALDIGKFHDSSRETASYTPEDLVRLLTPERMFLFADLGARIEGIIPSEQAQALKDMTDPLKMQLSPSQMKVIQEIIAKAGRKEWGFFAQAAMDMNAYLTAKNNGGHFVPKMLTAIDMKSAGRTFMAMDIGAAVVLKHVGVDWEYMDNSEYQNVLPSGSPRAYFIQLAQTKGIEHAFKDSDQETKQFWTQILKKYEQKYGKEFYDDFGKAVLMTTDYGKAYMFHTDEAIDLMNEWPDFAQEVMDFHNGDRKKAISGINDVYKGTLESAGDLWQQDAPKTIVKLLSMYNKVPNPKGMFDEDMFIGGFIEQSMGDSLVIDGVDRADTVELTKRIYSSLAKARHKGGKDLDGKPLPEPGEGTAAINQMGPVMGQYRESALIAMTLLYLNKGKAARDILFSQPVFDNLILSPSSMVQFYYVANNIIAPKVFAWNIQQEFVNNWQKQMAEGRKEVDRKNKVDIGDKGEYHGVLVAIDRERQYLVDKPRNELTQFQREFMDALEKPGSGFVAPEGDRSSVIVTAAQHYYLVSALGALKFSMFDSRAKGKGTRTSKLQYWLVDGLELKAKAMTRMKDLAKRGLLNFMS
jgi:hypothetical protein